MELASKELGQDFRRLLWDESGNVLPDIMIIGDRVESSTAGVLDETVESDLNIVIMYPVRGGITKKGALHGNQVALD